MAGGGGEEGAGHRYNFPLSRNLCAVICQLIDGYQFHVISGVGNSTQWN